MIDLQWLAPSCALSHLGGWVGGPTDHFSRSVGKPGNVPMTTLCLWHAYRWHTRYNFSVTLSCVHETLFSICCIIPSNLSILSWQLVISFWNNLKKDRATSNNISNKVFTTENCNNTGQMILWPTKDGIEEPSIISSLSSTAVSANISAWPRSWPCGMSEDLEPITIHNIIVFHLFLWAPVESIYNTKLWTNLSGK